MEYIEIESIIIDHFVEFENDEKLISSVLSSKINIVDCVLVQVMVEMRKFFMEKKDVQITTRSYSIKEKVSWVKRYIYANFRNRNGNDKCDIIFIHYQLKNIGFTDFLLRIAKNNGLEAKCFSLRATIDKAVAESDKNFISLYKYGLPVMPSNFFLLDAIKVLCAKFRCLYQLEDENSNDYFLFFENCLHRHIYVLATVEHLVEKAVKSIKPKLVFCTNDSEPLTRAFILHSKRYSAEVATIQHGLMQDWPLIRLMCTNAYFVWGNYYKNLLNFHRPDINSITLGSERHRKLLDKHYVKNDGVNNSILFALSPPSGRPITENMYLHILRLVYQTAIRYQNFFEVLIKLHPGDSGKIINEFINEQPSIPSNIHILGKQDDIYDLIYKSKVVVISSSTVGLESILFGKEVISLNFNFFHDLLPFKNLSNFHEVDNHNDFFSLLSRILFEETKVKYDSSVKEFIDVELKIEQIESYILNNHNKLRSDKFFS